ncbi:thioredoxin [Georgenia faecalis]|uniref:Thioredoxin n=1 Tax=Georgenia faecalis TaxID=2483799 RepID=A0ABV9D9D3_9MICO|nr:thioredoxin [Georgenia faecalis]
MSNVTAVTDDTFEDEVLKSDKPVLVDFWAGWCQPCLKMAPIVDEVAAEHAGIKVVKIDIDANPDVAQRYGIVSIPTFNVYSGGELAKTIVGGRPKPAFVKELSEFIG